MVDHTECVLRILSLEKKLKDVKHNLMSIGAEGYPTLSRIIVDLQETIAGFEQNRIVS